MKNISLSAIFLFLSSRRQNLYKNEYSDAPALSEEYPYLTFGVLTSARIAALDEDVLFCFNGKKYTPEAIEKKLNINLSDQSAISEKKAREYFNRNRIWFEGSTFKEVQKQVTTLTPEDFYREVINTIYIDSKIEYEIAERLRIKVNPTILVFDEQVRLHG